MFSQSRDWSVNEALLTNNSLLHSKHSVNVGLQAHLRLSVSDFSGLYLVIFYFFFSVLLFLYAVPNVIWRHRACISDLNPKLWKNVLACTFIVAHHAFLTAMSQQTS